MHMAERLGELKKQVLHLHERVKEAKDEEQDK
jgi:hypothetical protein